MMRSVRSLLLLSSVLLLAAFANPALATVIHGNYSGSTVDFNGVQETTNSPGDPEPLFEAPIVIGNSLIFNPSNFVATSTDGVSDQTAALLEMTLDAALGSFIETIDISEFGDTFLAGAGTASTGTFVGLSGFVTVLAADGPGAGTIIPWTGVFDQDTFDLVNDPGNSLWSGGVSIDVAGEVANVTSAFLQIDNFLFAASEAGTSSLIQKKVDSALVITVPEPTSFALVGLGVLGATLMGRRREHR